MTVTLPSISATKMTITIVDSGEQASVNNITINTAGGDTLSNGASSHILNGNGDFIKLISDQSSKWYAV